MQKHKKKSYLLLPLCCIIGLCICACLPLEILKIKTITIHNPSGLSTETITHLTNKYKNKNIIIKDIPYIETLTIKCQFPSMLRIIIKEKKPWLSLYSQGKNISIAEDGTFLDKKHDVPINNAEQLIIIKNLPQQILHRNALSSHYVNTFKQIVTAIQTVFPNQTCQIEPYKWNQWLLWLNDDIPIYINKDMTHLEKQLKNAKQALDSKHKKPKYIDLRIPKKVIIRYE